MGKVFLFLCLAVCGCAAINSSTKEPQQQVNQIKAFDPAEIERIISVFSRTLQTNPSYAGCYYNRAKAYFYMQDYAKSWEDVHKARALGMNFEQKFIDKLEKASSQQ